MATVRRAHFLWVELRWASLRAADPGRVKMRLMFFKVSKLILGALVMAAIVQMLLPPDVPARAKTGDFPPQINLDLENAAMAHGDVAEAAAIAVKDPRWGERPLLIVTPRDGAEPQKDALIAFLGDLLVEIHRRERMDDKRREGRCIGLDIAAHQRLPVRVDAFAE